MTAQDAGKTKLRRRTSGFRNARLRAAHTLPLGWRHLTAVDIDHLHAEVGRRVADKRLKLDELETCLMAWSLFVTGRSIDELLPLTFRIVPEGASLAREQHGLIRIGQRWGWWLPAGAPREQRSDRLRRGMRTWSSSIYLPATVNIAGLVDRCVTDRNRAAAGRIHISGRALPLFTCGDRLRKMVEALLASRHEVAPDRARRAATTPEALARWLPATITQQPGGDIVVASIITGHIDPVARTSSYYGSTSNEAVVRRYSRAVRAIDPATHDVAPGQIIDSYLGDRLTPDDAAVQQMIGRLAAALQDDEHDLATRHRAMTDYTVALLAFALAHRGWGSMPALADVDAETRLNWISDKAKAGQLVPRLVWISDIAHGQLAAYDRHLDQLQARVGPAAADTIGLMRTWRGLPLFDMADGPVEPCDVAEVTRRAVASVGGLTANAGRHWLRAQLVGQCSTESLHAFFGHGPVDDASWDWSSALDPVAYRADMARVLDPALEKIGWRVLDADGVRVGAS